MKQQPLDGSTKNQLSDTQVEAAETSDLDKGDSHQGTDPDFDSAQVGTQKFTSEAYLNRELSWIEFNRRVLCEAANSRTPLLERVKFLAIVSANIDEFHMKRMGGLKQQIGAGVTQLTIDGRTPEEQLEQCRSMLLSLQKEKESIYYRVLDELDRYGIHLCSYSVLNECEKESAQDYYAENVRPLVTPLVLDHSHPFPFISNLSLNILVAIKDDEYPYITYVWMNVPTGDAVSRFVRVGSGYKYVCLEELVMQDIDSLLPGADVIACNVFRITRNAITQNDHSGMEDMLEIITNELRNRKFAPVVRLQTGAAMHPYLQRLVFNYFELDEEKDVFESGAMVCMSDLMEIASLDVPGLHDSPHRPTHNVKLEKHSSIFECIRTSGSILLQHPYESFTTSVERFVFEASQDPQVASIKMTLYRTSADTKILDYLIDAAQRGKQVAVIVELKARFDEEANIRWSTLLEQAGVHVGYGVSNLKTHCKATLIIRKENAGLRRYAHIGTGNYHAGTARLYSDIGLLTCDQKLTEDMTELFNYLTTGFYPQRRFHRILATPYVIKSSLLAKIDREISTHSNDSPGLIRLKTNALEDPDITTALYKASRSGVRVELIVRDICRLKPGVEGLSDNIRVVSIIGRFLEHSRIYYFRNAGKEEYYIGSADLMTRNLERRVELLIPIESEDAKDTLESILEEQLGDSYCAWDMQPDGKYSQSQSTDSVTRLNCQQSAIDRAQKRQVKVNEYSVPDEQAISNQWLRLCF